MVLKRAELKFYKSSTPRELAEYIKANPDLKKNIDAFKKEYSYDFKGKKWDKISIFKKSGRRLDK